MATLNSKTRERLLIGDLSVASSFVARGIGLLDRKALGDQQGLWIKPCNNIHTFFMRFPIDCVFVDRSLRVKAIHRNVRPWRLIPWVGGAFSVFELAAGSVERLGIQIGEELHVGAEGS